MELPLYVNIYSNVPAIMNFTTIILNNISNNLKNELRSLHASENLISAHDLGPARCCAWRIDIFQSYSGMYFKVKMFKKSTRKFYKGQLMCIYIIV